MRSNDVEAIVVLPDGKILVGGFFSSIGGQLRNNLARLDPVTGLADSFEPNATGGGVSSIATQADGKIVVAGTFTGVGGQTRNRIARIDLTTGLADSFDPNSNNNVYSVALQSDGKILAGGLFGSIGGQTRTGFARLSNDTAAFSTLNVTQSSVSLTTDGSTALFSRVTFELSTDNGANYSFLGSVTPSLPASSHRRPANWARRAGRTAKRRLHLERTGPAHRTKHPHSRPRTFCLRLRQRLGEPPGKSAERLSPARLENPFD